MSQHVRSIAVWVIVLLFLAQVMIAIPVIQHTWIGPLQYPNRTYEQKMRAVWGTYFDFMQFIQTATPNTSVLLLDPNHLYLSLNLYFLYPRRLIYGDEKTLHKHPEVDYVVIIEGFPNFPVNGEKIMFDDKHGLYRIFK